MTTWEDSGTGLRVYVLCDHEADEELRETGAPYVLVFITEDGHSLAMGGDVPQFRKLMSGIEATFEKAVDRKCAWQAEMMMPDGASEG